MVAFFCKLTERPNSNPPPPPLSTHPIHPPTFQVEQGSECGLQLGKYKDFAEDDIVECFRVEWKTRSLAVVAGASGSLQSTSTKLEHANKTSGV